MKALINLWKDLAAQFRRRGALGARIFCVLNYWREYIAARRRGLGQGEARLEALRAIAAGGAPERTVVVSWPNGLSAELDLFSACYLATEVVDDAVYRRPGFLPAPGQTVVDVGAHQGLFTLQAARAVGPAGRVISVEPFPNNRALLERNIALNGISWATVVACAAAERSGEATLNITRLVSGGQSLVYSRDSDKKLSIRVEPLDAILESRGVGRVDLLKIDVEGAWRQVFAGAPRVLAARPRLVMEVEGGDAERDAAAARLRELGYETECEGSMVYALPRSR